MFKRIYTATAAASLSLGIMGTAHAGITIPPGEVTQAEYDAAQLGQTRHDVQAEFGTVGNLLSHTDVTRWKVYQADTAGAYAIATYQHQDGHWVLTEKLWFVR